jgi:hypothetical protein
MARLRVQLAEARVVARIDAVEEPFDASLQDGQRRAQLVRDVGHQLAAQAVLLGEDAGDAADRHGEASHDRERHHHRHRDRQCRTGGAREQRHERARAGRGEDDQGRERATDAAHDQRRSVMAAPGAVLVPLRPHAPVNL